MCVCVHGTVVVQQNKITSWEAENEDKYFVLWGKWLQNLHKYNTD